MTDDQTSSGAPPKFFSPNVRFGAVASLLSVLLCLPTWLGFGARGWWILELATHFTWHYAALLPAALALCCWRRQKWLVVLVAVTLAINVWRIAPYYLPANEASPQSTALRIVSLNVLSSNALYADVLQLVKEQKPDVLVLLEFSQAWSQQLAPLADDYAYELLKPRSDNFGIACYSNLDGTTLRVVELGDAEVPSIAAQLEWQGEPITIVGTHTLPPTSAENSRLRNNQLAAVAQFCRNQTGLLMVAGDLNITPYSPYFRDPCVRAASSIATAARASTPRGARALSGSAYPSITYCTHPI